MRALSALTLSMLQEEGDSLEDYSAWDITCEGICFTHSPFVLPTISRRPVCQTCCAQAAQQFVLLLRGVFSMSH